MAPAIQAMKIAIAAEIRRPSMPTQVVFLTDRNSHHSTAALTATKKARPKMLI